MFPLSRSFSREVRGDDGDGVGRLHRAPPNPSDVKINVEGAFIVDDETPSLEDKSNPAGEGVYFENKDIRLPYHTAVVSHVAVDVNFTTVRTLAVQHWLTRFTTDWRIAGEIGLLFKGAELGGRRRPAELPQLRDGPYRSLHRVLATIKTETIQA